MIKDILKFLKIESLIFEIRERGNWLSHNRNSAGDDWAFKQQYIFASQAEEDPTMGNNIKQAI